jgi:hypothetical protein
MLHHTNTTLTLYWHNLLTQVREPLLETMNGPPAAQIPVYDEHDEDFSGLEEMDSLLPHGTVCCLLSAVWCLLSAICCLLCATYCQPSAVCCLLG